MDAGGSRTCRTIWWCRRPGRSGCRTRFERAAGGVVAGQTIAVVPDGRLTRLFLAHLAQRHGDRVRVVRLDDAAPADGAGAALPLARAGALPGVDRFFVVSAQHHHTLHERLIALGVPADRIENLARPPEPLSVREVARLLPAAGCEEHAHQIDRFVDRRPCLVLFGPGYSDLFDKAAILREAFGARVIWVDPEAAPGERSPPSLDERLGLLTATTADLFLYLSRRPRRQDVLVLGLNASRGYAALALFRAAFPDVRLVGYVYDWLNLLCPPEHIDLAVRFLRSDRASVASEYRALAALIAGDICDGIVHKDGGDHFPLLASYPRPRLFFPPWPRRSLLHPPAPPPGRPRRNPLSGGRPQRAPPPPGALRPRDPAGRARARGGPRFRDRPLPVAGGTRRPAGVRGTLPGPPRRAHPARCPARRAGSAGGRSLPLGMAAVRPGGGRHPPGAHAQHPGREAVHLPGARPSDPGDRGRGLHRPARPLARGRRGDRARARSTTSTRCSTGSTIPRCSRAFGGPSRSWPSRKSRKRS